MPKRADWLSRLLLGTLVVFTILFIFAMLTDSPKPSPPPTKAEQHQEEQENIKSDLEKYCIDHHVVYVYMFGGRFDTRSVSVLDEHCEK